MTAWLGTPLPPGVESVTVEEMLAPEILATKASAVPCAQAGETLTRNANSPAATAAQLAFRLPAPGLVI
jgi:hypothetical protein